MHVLGATITDGKRAASWEKGQKNSKNSTESAFGMGPNVGRRTEQVKTEHWKATKEYRSNQSFSGAFGPLSSHPFSLIFPPLSPLQALFTLAPLLPSSPPPLPPPF